jgi:predicted dithiol-disulfide oxidoreductase (DUF899 family)
MHPPAVVTRAEWLEQRLALLAREKELNRERDRLAEARRHLPWVPIDKQYRFEGEAGEVSLADVFGGRGQLLVYHFMFGPDWDEGCPSCSFWADGFDGVQVHLAHRDTTMVCVSRAPYPKLSAYRRRMGWTFPWYSSGGSDFNADFHVSFEPGQVAEYNFTQSEQGETDLPGLSVFAVDDAGAVYHTYSAYSRGIDPINVSYQLLDLVPKGRDEAGLAWTNEWLRRHDAYDDG